MDDWYNTKIFIVECEAPQEFVDERGCEGNIVGEECVGCFFCPNIDFDYISSEQPTYTMYFDADRF